MCSTMAQMIGIWSYITWVQLGQPSHLQLVELGPGRGTLMSDLLRATASLAGGGFASCVDVHLVEMSPALRHKQWEALKCRKLDNSEGDNDIAPSSGRTAAGIAGTSQSVASIKQDAGNQEGSSSGIINGQAVRGVSRTSSDSGSTSSSSSSTSTTQVKSTLLDKGSSTRDVSSQQNMSAISGISGCRVSASLCTS